MKGSAFVLTLPKFVGEKREQMILDAVRRRDIAPIEWSPIETSFTNSAGHKYAARILVSKDAVRAGDAEDSFRVTTNHGTAQRIADELGVVLPTPKLSDEIWRQAVVRLPTLSQPHNSWVKDGTMSATYRMLEQSKHVDGLIVAEQHRTGKNGLIADVGKDWVTTNRLWQPYTPTPQCEKGEPRSANYGWHLAEPWQYTAETIAASVLQPVGLCHRIEHADYSQVVRLVRRDVLVCGPGMGATGCGIIDIRSIATDPAIAGLVSHTGVLDAMRHPGVAPSCDKRCPESVDEPPTDVAIPGNPPRPGGPVSCPVKCDKLLPAAVDPTYGMPSVQAGMTTIDKLVMFSAGVALGYFVLTRTLPAIQAARR